MIDKKPCNSPHHEGPKYVPLSEFHTYKDRRTPEGKIHYNTRCKRCNVRYVREWKRRLSDPERDRLKKRRRKQHAQRRRQENFVDNSLLRKAVEASDKPLIQIAADCGWVTYRKRIGKTQGDSARLKRAMGMLPSYSKSGTKYYQYSVSIDVAERLVKALEIDPWEIGL